MLASAAVTVPRLNVKVTARPIMAPGSASVCPRLSWVMSAVKVAVCHGCRLCVLTELLSTMNGELWVVPGPVVVAQPGLCVPALEPYQLSLASITASPLALLIEDRVFLTRMFSRRLSGP